MRRARWLAAAVAACLCAALLVVLLHRHHQRSTVDERRPANSPTTAGAPASAVIDGASGIGDPSYPGLGNGGYDVTHYAIAVRYLPSTGRLDGRTVLDLTPTDNLRSFHLDLALAPRSVVVDGEPAQFRTSGAELVIRPRNVLQAWRTAIVDVRYGGEPGRVNHGGGSPWRGTTNGAILAGEPEAAAWWFPNNDHPRDKATYDIALTVPAGLQAISNGTLVGVTDDQRTSTWRWKVAEPMASYLGFVAIGRYAIVRGIAVGHPFLTAAPPTASPAARASLAATPRILTWLQGLWGTYPFSSSGGVVVNTDLGFALENQTRPVYTPGFFGHGTNESVIVHENAHQWFGDELSVHNWRDIWLNEGFATYSEWLWAEHRGSMTAAAAFAGAFAKYRGDKKFWATSIGAPGPGAEFNHAVYVRGAMALQALRTRIGALMFLSLVRTWLSERRYDNGSVRDFVDLASDVTGEDLAPFFNTWLYGGTAPAASITNGFDLSIRARG
jgi:aminopeptidase N